MGKIIEYTLVSVDGAHSDPAGLGLRRPPLQDGLQVPLRLVSAKVFSHIAKLTYHVQARP